MKLLVFMCLLFLAAKSAWSDWNFRQGDFGGISEVEIDGRQISFLPEIPGGVQVEEITSEARKAVSLPNSGRFIVSNTLERRGQALLISAEITDASGEDSAANVFYQVPVIGSGWVWHENLNGAVPAEGEGLSQSNLPLSVLTDPAADIGLAVAITPRTPCIFSGGYSREHGLYIMARLGFSELAKPPCAARLEFAVYPVDGSWGMRSWLSSLRCLEP